MIIAVVYLMTRGFLVAPPLDPHTTRWAGNYGGIGQVYDIGLIHHSATHYIAVYVRPASLLIQLQI